MAKVKTPHKCHIGKERVDPFLPAEKKKFGKKIKKMALARPPSNAADRNFWRNHTLPGHENWDAISRERVL
jgi:hypothetical protein